MKIAGGILGLLGALFGLIVGSVGYGLSSAGNSINQASGGGAIFSGFQYAALLIPLIGLVGAGISFGKPKPGAVMMAVAAVLMVLVFGFHFVSLIPVSLLGAGALLAFLDSNNAASTKTASPIAVPEQTQPTMADTKVGDVVATFKDKKIIKESDGVSVDGVKYANRVAAEIAITNSHIQA
jgi:hypothetical protein